MARRRRPSPRSAWCSCCSRSGSSSRFRAWSPCGARCSGSARRRRWWSAAAGAALQRTPLRCRWPSAAVVVGGALAMCSTAIVLQQLGDQDELNRTHGRLSFAVLLFQDLAFVPLLALATVLAQGGRSSGAALLLRLVALGLLALVAVLAIGRWLLRPLLYEIAHSRLRELFTLAALLVVLTAAWITAAARAVDGARRVPRRHDARRDRVSASDRGRDPTVSRAAARSVLHRRGHAARSAGAVCRYPQHRSGCCWRCWLLKALLSALTVRAFGTERFKALRTGLVLAGGGEFGDRTAAPYSRAAPNLMAARRHAAAARRAWCSA